MSFKGACVVATQPSSKTLSIIFGLSNISSNNNIAKNSPYMNMRGSRGVAGGLDPHPRLARILQHVSPLTMAALSSNSLLYTLPYKIFDNQNLFKSTEKCKR